jgi:hypothetical protein
MFYRFNESIRRSVYSLEGGDDQPKLDTIYTGDIQNPWKSVYGFPTTAAKLASGQGLIFHCREDEVVDYLARLNGLLGDPECLNRAHDLLKNLRQQKRQKLKQLLEMANQSITDQEITGLLADIKANGSAPTERTVAERLACFLAPDNPASEIIGLGKMLSRLQRLMPALAEVKEQGFKVIVVDRQRKPVRPGTDLPLPIPHLTLWRYLIVRSDNGQSAVWN